MNSDFFPFSPSPKPATVLPSPTHSDRTLRSRSLLGRFTSGLWRSEMRDGGMASRVDHENDYLFKIVLIMTLVWANLTFSLDLPGMSSAWSPNPSSESSSPPELSRDESLHFAPLVLNWIHSKHPEI